MTIFTVTVTRTEGIASAVDADHERTARERHLIAGDEISSGSIETVIVSLEPTQA